MLFTRERWRMTWFQWSVLLQWEQHRTFVLCYSHSELPMLVRLLLEKTTVWIHLFFLASLLLWRLLWLMLVRLSRKITAVWIHLFLASHLLWRWLWPTLPMTALCLSEDWELLHRWCDYAFYLHSIWSLAHHRETAAKEISIADKSSCGGTQALCMARYFRLSVPRAATWARDGLLKVPRINFCVSRVPCGLLRRAIPGTTLSLLRSSPK